MQFINSGFSHNFKFSEGYNPCTSAMSPVSQRSDTEIARRRRPCALCSAENPANSPVSERDETEQAQLLGEFSTKAALLLTEAGGRMKATIFKKRWKCNFPDDAIERSTKLTNSNCPIGIQSQTA
jgi:hypothetical protein